MESKATREWRQIAQGDDVLYAIDSVPGMEGKWTPEAFYEHGRSDWVAFRRQWDHYDPERGGTVLEIGCGAGRLSAALAEGFERVIATDVSKDMLDRARPAVPDNVELRQTDGHSLPAADGEVDAVFSVHVLQHLEHRGDVVRYIEEAHRTVRPGGTAFIHIMLKGAPVSWKRRLKYELRLRRSRLALRLDRRSTPTMRVRTYWMDDVYRMFVGAGFENVEMRIVHAGPYGHSVWLARRPAA